MKYAARAMVFARFLAGFGPAAVASANGYTQIPIASFFGDGVAAFSFGASRLATCGVFYTTQYRLFNKCDVGLDYQSQPCYCYVPDRETNERKPNVVSEIPMKFRRRRSSGTTSAREVVEPTKYGRSKDEVRTK